LKKIVPLVINDTGLRETALKNNGGDALDSVIAAYETCRAVKNSAKPSQEASRDDYMREGYIYVQRDM